MKKLTREQKRRAQARRANMAAIACIVVFLLIGFAAGMFTASAMAEPAATPAPVEAEAEPATVVEVIEEPAELIEEATPLTYMGEFEISHYCACEICCGKSKDDPWYGITATGTKVQEGRTIAVDPTVIPYGSEVSIYYEDGTIGNYIAEDCGGAIQGNRIDVYMDGHSRAWNAGLKNGSVYVLEADA